MSHLRVLVVDDDPAFLANAEATLASARYNVSTADNFERAERIVRQARGRIVVLTELDVRGVSGLVFLSETIQRFPGLPFTFLSSNPPLESVIEALKHGAYDFLRKPVDPEILRHSVARSIEKLNLIVETEKQEKEIHDLLERSRADLRRYRTASDFKGFMISMAAHDFRSLFTVLDGYHQIFRVKCAGCPERTMIPLHEQVGRTIMRLRTMANTLLDFEAAGKGHLKIVKKQFDMREMLRESIEFYRPYAAQKNVSIVMEDGIPRLLSIGDPVRMGQVLDNLLFNALKFTPANGEILVGGDLWDGGLVRAWIRDTGIGMTPEQIEKIFDESAILSKKETTSRIGLGLMICRKLLEAQDGKIWVESSEGEGTTVRLSLPGASQNGA